MIYIFYKFFLILKLCDVCYFNFFFKGCMDKFRRYVLGGSNGEVCGRI